MATATITRNELGEKLAVCEVVVPKRTSRPLLENVLVRDGKLIATDLESWVAIDCPELEGEYLLPPALRSLIMRSADGVVTITRTEAGVRATIGGNEVELNAGDPSEFPDFAAVDPDPCFQISAETLHRMIDTVAFCADRIGMRYNLGGVLLERKNPHLTAVASDGRRLCWCETLSSGDVMHVLLPIAAAEKWRRIFAHYAEETVTVGLDGQHAVARCGPISLRSCLLDAVYPKWRTVLPPGKPVATVVVNRRDFCGLLEQIVPVLLSDMKRDTGGKLICGDGRVVIEFRNSLGKGTFSLPAQTEGEIAIWFNLEYLLTFFKRIDASACEMRFFGMTEAAVFLAEDVSYLQMPILREEESHGG